MSRTTKNVDFAFTRSSLDREEARLERLLELVPGFVSWGLVAGIVIVSLIQPIPAALVIIAFDLYWLLRIFYGTTFIVLAYVRLSIQKDTDWIHVAKAAGRIGNPLDNAIPLPKSNGIKAKINHWLIQKELSVLRASGKLPPPFEQIHHLVIVPVSTEAKAVIEPGLKSIQKSDFPQDRLAVIFALEAHAPEHVKTGVNELIKEYQNAFLYLAASVHPDGLAGEARVKGANTTYAAKEAAAYFQERQIPFEQVIVSCFDADTIVPPEYFSCLTYTFMACPHRERASFQPIPVYHNNFWKVPGFAKIIEMGSSFFMLAESTNPGKLVTFSSHSMSFKALVDVGYWPVDMISDDSSIFWKSFLHFNGDYRVVPLYVTVSMDVADAGVWWKTAWNVYRQKRRWAWGVEAFPVIVRGFLKKPKIPVWAKIRHAFRFLENHVTWATWSFLLALNWLPAAMVRREFETSIVYYSSTRISSVIFTLSSVVLAVIIGLSLMLLPKRKIKYPLLKRIGFTLEWLLLPFTYIVFNALPALDAQTRLMLGKRIEFCVTDKRR